MTVAYLDTSALAKLVIPEAESSALRAELSRWPDRATSVVGHVELRRAARRAALAEGQVSSTEAVIARAGVVELTREIVERAVHGTPTSLRSLDAIHLASAMALEGDLGVFIAYDRRLTAAAAELGLPVLSPA